MVWITIDKIAQSKATLKGLLFYFQEANHMNFIIWIIDNWIAKEDYYEMRTLLSRIEEVNRNNPTGSSNEKTNDFLQLLNENIIKLNHSTAVYSKCMLILTFFLTVISIVSIIGLFK